MGEWNKGLQVPLYKQRGSPAGNCKGVVEGGLFVILLAFTHQAIDLLPCPLTRGEVRGQEGGGTTTSDGYCQPVKGGFFFVFFCQCLFVLLCVFA